MVTRGWSVVLGVCVAACGAVEPPQSGERDARQGEFFDPEVVQEIRVEVAPEQLERMWGALPEQISVPVTFRWGDLTLEQVGMRFKGDSSSMADRGLKHAYLFKFAEVIEKQRFLGLRHVNLDNGFQFGSLFSERLITDVLRAEGVPAPRANYCRLYVNDVFQGVYVNVERLDKSFLERVFTDPSGDLFAVSHGGAGADLGFAGDDQAIYRDVFELKTNEDTSDHAQLVELLRDLSTMDAASFARWFDEEFSGEAFLRLMPIMLLAGAFDQYTGANAHNYYLYREPASGRWTYLPWDLDVGFADNAFGTVAVIDAWDASFPVPAWAARPLLQRIATNASLLASYRAYAADDLERHFHPDVMGARLDALYAQIEADLDRDPFPHKRLTNPEDVGYPGIITSLKAFMRRRYDTAAAQLANPRSTPPAPPSPSTPPPAPPSPPAPPPGGEPAPGAASACDPSGLVATVVGPTSVELRWIDNCSDEGAFIVQRSVGAACDAFQNAIGVPIPDTRTVTDTAAQTGMTFCYRVYAMRPSGTTGASNVVTATPQ